MNKRNPTKTMTSNLVFFTPFFSRSKLGAVKDTRKKSVHFAAGVSPGWHCNGCKKRNGDNWHGRVRKVPGFFRLFRVETDGWSIYPKNGWARLGKGGCSDVEIGPCLVSMLDLGVSKNRGTPKWMVYNGKPY